MRKALATILLIVAFSFITPTVTSCQQSGGSQRQGNPSVRVWVNTSSGVYHCPGSQWYGNTKRGEYMTQKQALDAGNRPAYGRYCK
jgi:hypothetical protein